MENLPGMELFFPTNPDLADILGDTDFDFENFDFWDVWIPDFWISRFLDSYIQGCHLVIFVRGGSCMLTKHSGEPGPAFVQYDESTFACEFCVLIWVR